MRRIALSFAVIWSLLAGTAFAIPDRVQNARVTVVGSTVTVAWDAVPGALSYIVLVGGQPGFQDVTVMDVGLRTSVTVSDVAAGVYYFRVAARDLTGAGGTSTEVPVTVGAGPCAAPPMAPINLTSTVGANNRVRLRWFPALVSCPPSSYVLEAGTAPAASDVAVVALGDTLIDTVAPPGTYYVRVAARNAFGQSPLSRELAVQVNGRDGVRGWVEPNAFNELPVTGTAGPIQATVTWTDPTASLDLFVVAGSCLSPYNCSRLGDSTLTLPAQRQLVFDTAGQNVFIVVGNRSGAPTIFSLVLRQAP